MQFSWNSTPRIVVTADTDDFDPATIQHFEEEGFIVSYLPYNGDRKEYNRQLKHLGDPMELGDRYALIGFGEAAALVLEACRKPMPKLRAVVAYYPPYLPKGGDFPSALNILIHLAASQPFAVKFPSFTYKNSQVGFAEEDLDEYDPVGARLAWSRTLRCLREAFELSVDHEPEWEKHLNLKYASKDVDATISTYAADATVNHVPVMTGGIGRKELHRFYADYFTPGIPPSLNMRLVSRTVGVDRVVDEMYISFKHTQEIPWMLPGVPPTDKNVEVALVSVVTLRGGKLCQENVYWDQASVLLQLGLLDPNQVPSGFKAINEQDKVERLPVTGPESAWKVLDDSSEESNRLIPDW